MHILAIDLGKFNSMCCFFDTETQEYSFWPAATTRRYLRTVLEKNAVDLVVMEACGPSGWIHDLCREMGKDTLVCSTNEEAWWWKNVKRKTDKTIAEDRQLRGPSAQREKMSRKSNEKPAHFASPDVPVVRSSPTSPAWPTRAALFYVCS